MDNSTCTLIEGSLEKAEQKLSAARTLLASGDFDDATSRAYYAAFHAAQAILLSDGLTTATHRGLLNMFGLHFVKTGRIQKKYAKLLANLKDDREHGDYEIYSTINKQTAKQALCEATEFVSGMKEYLRTLPEFGTD